MACVNCFRATSHLAGFGHKPTLWSVFPHAVKVLLVVTHVAHATREAVWCHTCFLYSQSVLWVEEIMHRFYGHRLVAHESAVM